jgi:hypothetical protein
MSECEFLPACPFFNDKMKDLPGLTQIYKKKYCLGDEKNNCARLIVRNTLGKEKVPTDLYPNQIEKANMLIAQN